MSVLAGRLYLTYDLNYGWQVSTLWINCLLWVSQLGQLSLLSFLGR